MCRMIIMNHETSSGYEKRHEIFILIFHKEYPFRKEAYDIKLFFVEFSVFDNLHFYIKH